MGSLCKLQVLDLSFNKIAGEITSLVEELSKCSPGSDLHYLSLAGNNLNGTITAKLGQLSKLEELYLYYNSFVGKVTEAHFSNLINLKELILSGNHLEMMFSQDWVPPFNAYVIDMSSCHMGPDFPNWIRTQTLLEDLSMAEAGISDNIPSWFWNYDIVSLDMSNNQIRGQLPPSLQRIHYRYLDLSSNYFDGHIPNLDPTNLFLIDLSNNSFCGPIPSSLAAAKGIRYLCLSNNHLTGTIQTFNVYNLTSLYSLDLSNNNLTGTIPPFNVYNLTSLYFLDLSNNHLTGTIPPFNSPQLGILSLSNNHLTGTIPPFNVYNLTSLRVLDLSNNNLTGTIPPFNSPQLYFLSLSNNHLTGTIPTFIVYNLTSLYSLDLSNNNLTGTIPPFNVYNLTSLYFLDLSNNNLTGTIPPFNSPQLVYIILSNNHLTGTIPPFNNLTSLQALDLSKNNLGGRLPLFNSPRLVVLDLSSNNFSSHIPDSVGSLTNLQSLHLGNNSLTGRIPWSLHHCRRLVVLDLGENRLSGGIPAWIGEHLPLLRVLRLRSNFFRGDISFPICRLTNLQVLDLANNSLSGILSPSSLNFSAMLQTLNVDKPMIDKFYGYKESLMVTVKGTELVYTTVLSLVTSIDLSSNVLYGEIPKELAELHGLVFLNLSRNHFTGEIPENIGAMGQLESLDLSMNKLSGSIPPSMSNLDFLGHLNLSHNNLSGRIPSGNHLQTFFTDPSIYSGNLELCGWPLSECSSNEPSQAPSHEGGGTEEKKDETDVIWIYGIAAAGFIIGFWSVIGTLLIKVSWRITYFQLVDRFCDWVYVKVAISIARWKSIILKD